MLRIFFALIIISLAAPACSSKQAEARPQESYAMWLAAFKTEARAKGISSEVLTRALEDTSPDETVVKLDRKQPESKFTLDEYLERVLPQSRIDTARKMYRENRTLLNKISDEYGVQPEYIVALWGIESNFGERMGSFNVVNSLATLAYDGRRREFFTKELLNALTIIQQGHISVEEMEGSWAGAMGQCQFMPSSFLRYAVDYDGDGHKDIWHTRADVFASIANYLHSEGWDGSRGWGSRDNPKDNFDVILKWNRSTYFATAVGTLAYVIH